MRSPDPTAASSPDRGWGLGHELKGAQPRVLLVEDDPALRQMLDWGFSDIGYEVLTAGSCQEAREISAREPFDLALLDIGLPDGDGMGLARELVGQSGSIRVVLCTGGHAALAKEAPGILACLTKPVCLDQVDSLFRRG